MKTAQQWNAILGPCVTQTKSVIAAYKVVEVEARRVLGSLSIEEYLTTMDLVEELYPEEQARGMNAGHARQRVIRALQALAPRSMRDCAAKGDAKIVMGRERKPWKWVKPGTLPSTAEVIPLPTRPRRRR